MQDSTNQMAKIERLSNYFVSTTPQLHLVLLVTFFAVLTVVFAQPVKLIDYAQGSPAIPPIWQIAIMAASGVAMLAASRTLMRIYNTRHHLSPMGIALWVVAELVIVVAAMCLIVWGLNGVGRLMLPQLAGDITLGIISIMVMPYALSLLLFLLQCERRENEALRVALLEHEGVNPTMHDGNVFFHDKAGRLMLAITGKRVLYIEAANNYTNIHYDNEGREETFILHNSMKELEHNLEGSGIVRCHRGYMVNIANVRLVRKEGTGLLLEVEGAAKPIPVTKTYIEAITQHLNPE